MYSDYLRRQGNQVLEARSAVEGLKLAREQHPGLAVLDASLPDLNGWQATKQLKADPATLGICVVMLTEDTIASLQGQTEDTGVDIFLRKPLQAAELWRAIEARLNSPPADRQRDSEAAGS